MEDVLARRRSSLLMPAGAISVLLVALACVGVDVDMCGVSFMGVRISATFLAYHSLPCLGILCKNPEQLATILNPQLHDVPCLLG